MSNYFERLRYQITNKIGNIGNRPDIEAWRKTTLDLIEDIDTYEMGALRAECAGLGLEIRDLKALVEKLHQRIDGLEAARIAYASEFDGDVGSIHKNIRDLKDECKVGRERFGPAGWKLLTELLAKRKVVVVARKALRLKGHGNSSVELEQALIEHDKEFWVEMPDTPIPPNPGFAPFIIP